MAGFGGASVAYLDDHRQNQLDDAMEIPTADGGVVIQFGTPANAANAANAANDNEDDFYENLAEKVDPSTLGALAWEILDGIQADETSRTQWISDRTRGLDLLAIKVETPRADIGGSGAPMDGMSTVRHPLLLEACIKFQSNFKREMLPASGPIKIKNEGDGNTEQDLQAEKLSDLLNRYLTEFSPEYYPDTDRMSFDVGFSGMGFKKLYHCPLRRRPVSDTVQGKDLIVSNDATDLRTAQRVTHQISMTKGTLKRMQFVGAYRKVELNQPDGMPENSITQKQRAIQGVAKSVRPKDQPYTIYECYTTADLRGYEHTDDDGEETGLPMPYKITIDRASRQILEIRRNWDEDGNDTFEPRRVFVAFPFVPMFGFYATGLLHILGNATQAVTGAWRILLDTGIFANFPGFLYAKNGARQDNLNFRVPPGGGAGVDLGGADDIRKTIMALPYKDPGANTMTLVDNIINTGQRVGGTANMIDPNNVRQNMPVGTTMAIIEQAAQTIGAVHERNFISQSHEFQQLLVLLREDPDALWRFVEKDGTWTKDELIQTLNIYTLIPVADPNTPTHVHRIMKMTTLKQLQQSSPEAYDVRKVDTAILRALKFGDPQEFFVPPAPPGAAPPDPAVIVAQTVKETKMADIQARTQLEAAKLQHAQQVKGAEMQHAQQTEAAKLAHAKEIEGMKAHIKAMELELKKMMGQQTEDVKMAGIETTADTADKDRASNEAIEVAKLHHAQQIKGAEMSHADQTSARELDHNQQTAHIARMDAETQRDHDASEAELDRAHAIRLEKAKPRPKPSSKK